MKIYRIHRKEEPDGMFPQFVEKSILIIADSKEDAMAIAREEREIDIEEYDINELDTQKGIINIIYCQSDIW